MENRKIFFISILIFMIVLGVGAVSAQDSNDTVSATDEDVVLGDSQTVQGTVSGDVDVESVNPWNTSGELNYDVPADAKTIKSADVYVNVYGGSAKNTYGANANVSFTTDNGVTTRSESLWTEEGSTDGSVYTVNDHTTKCYSDYMIHYDVTGLLQGLNGTHFKINVDTFKMENKSFDGRIKLIALVLGYDDGDTDNISYWVDANQLWSKSNVNVTFDTESVTSVYEATLENIVLSSGDGSYKLNGEFLGDAQEHVKGTDYYYYNKWDVASALTPSQKTTFNVAYAGSGAYGSIKNVLAVLKVVNMVSDITVTPEYANTAYAGTNNTLTVKVNTTKAGKYTLRLLANNVVVSQAEVDLNESLKEVFLTDPTIMPVDASTVNGAENNKVNYTVELMVNNRTVNSKSLSLPILYNGNLGKELAYPAGGMESFLNTVITGDIVIDIKDVSSYLTGATKLNRSDVWTVSLGENSTIVKSFVYVAYNWCDPSLVTEGVDMFNATFNGVKVTPVALYRDQSNLGGYGKYGYGLLVYDVTDLTNKSGDNTFFISKSYRYPAVYPSTFIYMYNTTGSKAIKEIYLSNGADLLASTNNVAKRPVKADSTIDVYSKLASDATLYVFAAGAQTGEGNIVFNGQTYENVWSGTSQTTDLYTIDATGKIKDSNSISFVGTGSTILALQQIMVLTKNQDDIAITLTPEYTNTAYAGTNNAITVTVDLLKSGKYTVKLLADNVVVNQTEIDLVGGTTNKFILIDPTVRPVDASTVNGAANNMVNYTLQLVSGDENVANKTITLPILYNGNLGKDLAYPAGGMESFLNISINGDIVIDIKDVSSYLTGTTKLNRSDVWTINLDAKSSIVKSFVYVAYNWCDPAHVTEGVDMFNATFNGVKVTPVAFYRDQSNLGTYAKYGYGLLVYDVTDLTNKSGDNTFFISKSYKYPAVYPSALIYMYNTTGSAVIKNIYISNGADLIAGTSNNVAKRPVHADSTIDVVTGDAAELYVFAAGAQVGEGNIIFNGNVYENVWSGTSQTTDLYTLDITGTVKNSNNISFVGTGSTIVALQQIIVTTKNAPAEKIATKISAPSVTAVYNTNKNLVVTLKDANDKVISGAKVTVVLNGKTSVLKTDSKGQAKLAIPSNLAPKNYYKVSISYAGDGTHIKSSATTKVIVKKASVKLTAKKKTFKAKTKTKKYTVILKNNKGKVMKKVKLSLKVKGKTFKATTNAKGKATFKITNLKKKGKFTAKVTFSGNKYFNKKTVSVKLTIKK